MATPSLQELHVCSCAYTMGEVPKVEKNEELSVTQELLKLNQSLKITAKLSNYGVCIVYLDVILVGQEQGHQTH